MGLGANVSAQDFVNDTMPAKSGNAFPLASSTENKVEVIYQSSDFNKKLPTSYYTYIKNIYIRLGNACNSTYADFTVSMASIPKIDSGSRIFTSYVKTVYGPVKQTIKSDANVWIKIPLSAPFAYNPKQILVVTVKQDQQIGQPAEWSCRPVFNGLSWNRMYGGYGKDTAINSDKYEYDFGFDTTNAISYNNAGICSLISPLDLCPSTSPQDVTVRLCNLGVIDLSSVSLGWSLDNVVQTPLHFGPGPPVGSYTDIKLTSLVFSKGKYHTLKAWTYLPNGVKDSTPQDDSLIVNSLGPDTTRPLVTLQGKPFDSMQVAYLGHTSTYTDLGFVVTDDNNAVITTARGGSFYTSFSGVDNVDTVGTYKIIYTATDQCGNTASVTRQVKVYDHVPPVITINGNAVASVCQGAVYQDAGCTVTDNYYGTKDIRVDTFGTFVTDGHTAVPGTYYIRFQATDKSGNTAITANHRTIFVIPVDSLGCKSGSSGFPVSENGQNDFVIYPNPNEGLFILKSNGFFHPNMQITVSDALGRQIQLPENRFLSNQSLDLDLASQPSGLYFIHIQSKDQTANLRVVIKK